MNELDVQAKRQKAAATIANLLRDLEIETGRIVSDLNLHEIDVTSISDPGPRRIMTVTIGLHRLPGHLWNGAE